MKFSKKSFCRIPKRVEWIAPRVVSPRRYRVNFEKRSTLAVAMVENPQNGRFFRQYLTLSNIARFERFLAYSFPI